MKERSGQILGIAAAAIAGGALAYGLPLSLFEMGVTTTGLSEILPALAPPLGDTARTLIIGASALLCGLLAAVIVLSVKGGAAEDKHEGTSMSLLFSRLTSFARALRPGQSADKQERETAPLLRRSDSHPDAPARQPLFARRELGDEMLPPVHGPANDSGWDDQKPVKAASRAQNEGSVAARRIARIRGEGLPPAEEVVPVAPVFVAAPSPASGDVPLSEAASVAKGIGADASDAPSDAVGEVQPFPHQPLAMKPSEEAEAEADIAMPRAPEPLPWHLIEEEMSRIMSGDSVASSPIIAEDVASYDDDDGGDDEEEASQTVFAQHSPFTVPPVAATLLPSAIAEQAEGAETTVVEAAALQDMVSVSTNDAYHQHEPLSAPEQAQSLPHVAPAPAPGRPAMAATSYDSRREEALPAISHLVDRLEQGLARRHARRMEQQASSKADTGAVTDEQEGELNAFPTNSMNDQDARLPVFPAPAIVAVAGLSGAGPDGDDLQRALAALRATTARAS